MTVDSVDTPAPANSPITIESTCSEFGTRGALMPKVILIFIEGVGVAAVAFMLTFFNAMVRELRYDRAPVIVERQKNCSEPATTRRYQQQNRAA